jgi:hypothetical protein
MSREENVGKNHNIETGMKSFPCVAKFRLLGKNVTKTACMSKLRVDTTQEILAIVRSRIFVLDCPKIQILKNTRL